jgi:hypothetical protein
VWDAARGEQQSVLLPEERYALSPIDSLPTKAALDDVFGASDALNRLAAIAVSNLEFGFRLRAIRALPHFCAPTGNCANPLVHSTLIAVLDNPPAPAETLGQTILKQRAAIEALGVANAGDPQDVQRFLVFLVHPSRDLRATAARALRDTCSTVATPELRARYQDETIPQVRLAIENALNDLSQCSQ